MSAAIDERIFEDPADAGGIGPQCRGGARRQLSAHLVEIFEHPRARPVEVGSVLEDDVDVGIAEERVAAHRHRLGHREHRGGQRVGDLVLDDLRRLAGKRGLDDDLHVGKVGQGIDWRLAHRVQATDDEKRGSHQDQGPVPERPPDERCDHRFVSMLCPE